MAAGFPRAKTERQNNSEVSLFITHYFFCESGYPAHAPEEEVTQERECQEGVAIGALLRDCLLHTGKKIITHAFINGVTMAR
jgi:hypothetical protein